MGVQRAQLRRETLLSYPLGSLELQLRHRTRRMGEASMLRECDNTRWAACLKEALPFSPPRRTWGMPALLGLSITKNIINTNSCEFFWFENVAKKTFYWSNSMCPEATSDLQLPLCSGDFSINQYCHVHSFIHSLFTRASKEVSGYVLSIVKCGVCIQRPRT